MADHESWYRRRAACRRTHRSPPARPRRRAVCRSPVPAVPSGSLAGTGPTGPAIAAPARAPSGWFPQTSASTTSRRSANRPSQGRVRSLPTPGCGLTQRVSELTPRAQRMSMIFCRPVRRPPCRGWSHSCLNSCIRRVVHHTRSAASPRRSPVSEPISSTIMPHGAQPAPRPRTVLLPRTVPPHISAQRYTAKVAGPVQEKVERRPRPRRLETGITYAAMRSSRNNHSHLHYFALLIGTHSIRRRYRNPPHSVSTSIVRLHFETFPPTACRAIACGPNAPSS